MTPRKKPEKAFNPGTLINITSIFGGLLASGAIYVIGNWFLYGNELARHDLILSKLSDTVGSLNTTVAVLGEQNKDIAKTLAKISDQKR